MSSFIFQNRTCVYFGQDRLNNLPHVLKRRGRRVLILTGCGSAERNGTLDQVTGYLEGYDLETDIFRGIGSDPDVSKISELVSFSKRFKPDVILAFGGGAVIDSAKALSAAYYAEEDDLWSYFAKNRCYDNVLPVAAVPTTIGTGSEMNGGFVLSDKENGIKRGFGSFDTQPVAAFYNPRFTDGLSKRQIAAGAADIIAHVFDSGYFTKGPRMELLWSLQTGVIRSVIRNARELMKDLSNDGAREGLMWASAMGLNGFLYENLKQDASIHIIGHQISADYNIPHGEGIAVVLPRWLRSCICEETAGQIARFGADCFDICQDGDVLKTAEQAADSLESFLYGELALEKSLLKYGVPESGFRELSRRVVRFGEIFGFLKLDEEAVYNIICKCK